MFSRGIRADAGARVRARKNTAKYAAELRLYTRTRMFESGATSAFRVCVGARCSRARAAVCWWESREREREKETCGLCGCVSATRRSRSARVSHQQLMAGATQLVVTGAFARASLSLAAYQLRATRKTTGKDVLSSSIKKPERKSAVVTRRRLRWRWRSFEPSNLIALSGINETRSRNTRREDYTLPFHFRFHARSSNSPEWRYLGIYVYTRRANVLSYNGKGQGSLKSWVNSYRLRILAVSFIALNTVHRVLWLF